LSFSSSSNLRTPFRNHNTVLNQTAAARTLRTSAYPNSTHSGRRSSPSRACATRRGARRMGWIWRT
jgi:hypothetical protein